MRRTLLVAAFATAAVASQPLVARAETRSSLDAFLSAYRCPVVDRLEQVYAGGDQRSESQPIHRRDGAGASTRLCPVHLRAAPNEAAVRSLLGLPLHQTGRAADLPFAARSTCRTRPPRLLERRYGRRLPARVRRCGRARFQSHCRVHADGACTTATARARKQGCGSTPHLRELPAPSAFR